MTPRQQKLQQSKINALVTFLDATTGPMDAASLARSYGVDEPEITKILTRRGRLQHGKSTVSV